MEHAKSPPNLRPPPLFPGHRFIRERVDIRSDIYAKEIGASVGVAEDCSKIMF
jgi:hypothetical protein